MASFIPGAVKPTFDMAEAAVRTDKGLQVKVLAAIGILATIMIGIVLMFLETTTITYAAILVLVSLLIAIIYLAIDL